MTSLDIMEYTAASESTINNAIVQCAGYNAWPSWLRRLLVADHAPGFDSWPVQVGFMAGHRQGLYWDYVNYSLST
jgi:hypothetical protein